MRLVALLIPSPPGPTPPLIVGGITVLERQRRQARLAKADLVLTLDEAAAPAALVSAIADEDRVLVLAPGLVVDERAVAAVLDSPAPALGTWPGVAAARYRGAERLDATTLAAGVGVFPGALVRRIAATLGDWDLHATLTRAAAADPDTLRVDLAALDPYAPARRRIVPLAWAIPLDERTAAASTRGLVGGAQKGVLDWPARFLHPPIEDALVWLLLPTPITPNMVTVVVALIGFAAIAAFAGGWLWTGLLLALVSGPLDGVDGKLARTRLEFSRFGDLEHVLDKICEYGWFAGLAFHFSRELGHDGPWALAVLIIVAALAEAGLGEFYRRFTGRQLDDAGAFERRFRLVGGRRNTFFWSYVPFAALGLWHAGFVMIAIYAVVTFVVVQLRFFKRLGDYGRAHSATIAANFAGTSYGFLPVRKASGR